LLQINIFVFVRQLDGQYGHVMLAYS